MKKRAPSSKLVRGLRSNSNGDKHKASRRSVLNGAGGWKRARLLTQWNHLQATSAVYLPVTLFRWKMISGERFRKRDPSVVLLRLILTAYVRARCLRQHLKVVQEIGTSCA